MLGTKPIAEEVAKIVGSANVRRALPEDAVCAVAAQFVAEPEDEQQVAGILSWANATGISVIPRGGGTKMEWGNAPKRADLILSTARLNRIVEHAWADLTVTVEAGCTLQSLETALAKHGQRLAFDGLWREHATVGGALSTNDSGALRLRFGALRDLIIGITLALPDGTLAKSGGKVVKNVAGYDLPKLATGALGTLGVITRAVFRLHPTCPSSNTLTFSTPTWSEMQKKLHAIQDSKLAHSALQIRGASGEAPKADAMFEATAAGLAAQSEQLQKIVGGIPVSGSASAKVWQARNSLFSSRERDSVIAKFSTLPSEISKVMGWLEPPWRAVIQATGIGVVRLDADVSTLAQAVTAFRAQLERLSGSFVLLHRPESLRSIDGWGEPGDALPLMRAVKQQLDPQRTLNPGRFVGGI